MIGGVAADAPHVAALVARRMATAGARRRELVAA
jgi:hypothetical protein